MSNPLARAVGVLNKLPTPVAQHATTLLFNRNVRFSGTAGLRFEHLDTQSARLWLRNLPKVRNHIGGIHAAATALLAEAASGAVFAMNVRKDAVPLLKSMQIDYLQRAHGDLRAHAQLDDASRAQIQADAKGDIAVPVTIVDAQGNEPVRCTLHWAWVPKRAKR